MESQHFFLDVDDDDITVTCHVCEKGCNVSLPPSWQYCLIDAKDDFSSNGNTPVVTATANNGTKNRQKRKRNNSNGMTIENAINIDDEPTFIDLCDSDGGGDNDDDEVTRLIKNNRKRRRRSKQRKNEVIEILRRQRNNEVIEID